LFKRWKDEQPLVAKQEESLDFRERDTSERLGAAMPRKV